MDQAVTPKLHVLGAALAIVVALASPAPSQTPSSNCPVANPPQAPFRIYGDSYYVGGHGLGAILIASASGHILIDGDLPESASSIAANIRALGFQIQDVKLIVNSHVHCDHAGGIAELQRLSGAKVATSPSSADVLRQGAPGRDDPQYGVGPPVARVANVEVLRDGETLNVGGLAITAHFTPGHTQGGTSWTWQTCEPGRCLNIVYADSLTAVSADAFFFTRSTAYPTALMDFEKSFSVLEALPCDILITPHPEFSQLWEKLQKRNEGDAGALVDHDACKNYVAAARAGLARRIESESQRKIRVGN